MIEESKEKPKQGMLSDSDALDTIRYLKNYILSQLAKNIRLGGPAKEAVVDPLTLAKAGIIHLLAVRRERWLRNRTIQQVDPTSPLLKDNWADEEMADKKIVDRLTAPEVKAYLVHPELPRRDDIYTANPYYSAAITQEVVMAAKEELRKTGYISAVSGRSTKRVMEDEVAKGSHSIIAEQGLKSTPFGDIDMHRFTMNELARSVRETKIGRYD